MEDMLASWAGIAGYLGALMVIAASIDAVVRERSLGVTAWIITKPVSRLSYLLAKAAGHALTAAIAIIGIPSLVWLLLPLRDHAAMLFCADGRDIGTMSGR